MFGACRGEVWVGGGVSRTEWHSVARGGGDYSSSSAKIEMISRAP